MRLSGRVAYCQDCQNLARRQRRGLHVKVQPSIWALILITIAGQGAFAAANKDEYELRERCGKLARELFQKEFGNGISNTTDGQSITGFENHYSSRHNSCFEVLTTTFLNYKQKPQTTSTSVELWDMNDNKQIGE